MHIILSYLLMIAVFSDTVSRWNDRKDYDRIYREMPCVICGGPTIPAHFWKD